LFTSTIPFPDLNLSFTNKFALTPSEDIRSGISNAQRELTRSKAQELFMAEKFRVVSSGGSIGVAAAALELSGAVI
jgi:hypothetical protein